MPTPSPRPRALVPFSSPPVRGDRATGPLPEPIHEYALVFEEEGVIRQFVGIRWALSDCDRVDEPTIADPLVPGTAFTARLTNLTTGAVSYPLPDAEVRRRAEAWGRPSRDDGSPT